MDYISKYKCRYCQNVFNGGITSNDHIAFNALIHISIDIPQKNNAISKTEPHIAADHYGIGEFIGFEIRGGAT